MKIQVVQTGELLKVIYTLDDELVVETQVSVRGDNSLQFNMRVLKDGKMIFFSDNPASLPRWLGNES